MLRRGGGGGVRGVLRPQLSQDETQNHAHTRPGPPSYRHQDRCETWARCGGVPAAAAPHLRPAFLLHPQAIATVLLGSTLGALCAVAALMLVDRFLQQTHGLDTA